MVVNLIKVMKSRIANLFFVIFLVVGFSVIILGMLGSLVAGKSNTAEIVAYSSGVRGHTHTLEIEGKNYRSGFGRSIFSSEVGDRVEVVRWRGYIYVGSKVHLAVATTAVLVLLGAVIWFTRNHEKLMMSKKSRGLSILPLVLLMAIILSLV